MRTCLLIAAAALIIAVPSPARAADEGDEEIARTQEKMAELYESKDDFKSALKIWRELLVTQPDKERYLDQVARLAVQLNDYQTALTPSRKLAQRFPQSARYRARLISVLLALKLDKEAMGQLEWMKRRSPNDPEVHKELATAYEAAKRNREALSEYDWLLARYPKNVDYRLARASLLGDLNREQEQLKELELLATMVPAGVRAAEVHRQIGEIYYHREDYDKAEAHLGRALAAAPSDKTASSLLAKIRATRAEAKRRALAESEEAERYEDWLSDIQERAEDI
jgi:predicted Zn-dependent protease